MIGSFWNLCRACPSMPSDKVKKFEKIHIFNIIHFHVPVEYDVHVLYSQFFFFCQLFCWNVAVLMFHTKCCLQTSFLWLWIFLHFRHSGDDRLSICLEDLRIYLDFFLCLFNINELFSSQAALTEFRPVISKIFNYTQSVIMMQI